MSLFNEYGNVSIDNQNAVSSLSFYFLKKKFQFNEKACKSFFKGTSLCHFKSQQRTVKIKESVLSNQFCQL